MNFPAALRAVAVLFALGLPMAALAGGEGDSLAGVRTGTGAKQAGHAKLRVVRRDVPRAAVPAPVVPVMRWGSRGSEAWTRELLATLEADGARLVQTVPGDVSAFCPGYVTASAGQRRAFWAGLVSSIAKHESTWNPKARGGGGKWLGLMQIAPSTWRAHGCDGQILDGGDNLSCAVRIMAKQVGRDGVIAGGGARGVGRDWAPMRSGAKRADIAGWTRKQSYCNG